jgi:hypothetical protein
MLELLQTALARTRQTKRLRDERRLVERVLRHWTKMAAGRRVPRLNEIDPWMVGNDWTNCLLIAVQSPIELSHFTVVGENLAVALCPGDTLAGMLLSHLPWVVSSRCCLIVQGRGMLRGVPILYRGALLPLSEDDGAIDHVLGAANHRALPADEADAPHPDALDLDGGFLSEVFLDR